MEEERLVAILDSCQYSAQGLRLIFEQLPGWRVAGCSTAYPEFIQLINGKKIDLIICGASHFEDDFSRILYLPGLTDGFSVLLTNKHSPVLANLFLTTGFDLVLSKQMSLAELEQLFIYRQFYTNVVLLKNKKHSRYLPQERSVLSALLRGEKARDIARRLGMSYSTVSRHKQNGLKRAGVRSLNEILLSLKQS
ncbi:response regulator transcription factor [Klebsiella aerogenes]